MCKRVIQSTHAFKNCIGLFFIHCSSSYLGISFTCSVLVRIFFDINTVLPLSLFCVVILFRPEFLVPDNIHMCTGLKKKFSSLRPFIMDNKKNYRIKNEIWWIRNCYIPALLSNLLQFFRMVVIPPSWFFLLNL